jgi:hypothetical protein
MLVTFSTFRKSPTKSLSYSENIYGRERGKVSYINHHREREEEQEEVEEKGDMGPE